LIAEMKMLGPKKKEREEKEVGEKNKKKRWSFLSGTGQKMPDAELGKGTARYMKKAKKALGGRKMQAAWGRGKVLRALHTLAG